MKALLRAASLLQQAKPRQRARETIYVVHALANVFMGRVGVFLDADYAAAFETRNSPYQTWTPLPPERNLATSWASTCAALRPARLSPVSREEPDGPVHESEVRMWREPLPAPLK